ncbi:MAG: gliding motility-associated ABC transporter ATP-binding subunit GldA [Reichenbachiella sp.]
MSIIVENLSKSYGSQIVVNNISFEAKKGEILGFLGPNGAGKSTTMKIATGYLNATNGSVSVSGYNVEEDTLKAQESIGYLPEHNPLYLDMYVHEYLNFSGRIYKIPKKLLKERIDSVILKCGLAVEQNKQIGQLSKGYRQRVGLAQALLHNPKILILDEPTTGLDPNQILEIRKLIKEVSKDKTVIFSSHIMQEVKALCDRVIVINKGKMIADMTIEEFSTGFKQETQLKVEFKHEIDSTQLENLSTIIHVNHEANGNYILTVSDSDKSRSEVFQLAADKSLPLVGLQEIESSLEEIFQNLTQEVN